MALFSDKRGRWITHLLLLSGILWVGYDIRMGVETMGYYLHDLRSTTNTANPTFRDRRDFYGFANFVNQALKDRHIATTTPLSLRASPWPYQGSLSYMLYPYNVTYQKPDAHIFLVYDDPEVALNGQTVSIQ